MHISEKRQSTTEAFIDLPTKTQPPADPHVMGTRSIPQSNWDPYEGSRLGYSYTLCMVIIVSAVLHMVCDVIVVEVVLIHMVMMPS